jgi:pimeloyl-ACP methyl ester carboxylesterase
MAPVARALADSFRVIEPFQRRSGGGPLSVARHVADLHELLSGYPDDPRPALAGASWGAMLALAYAAEHPGSVGPLALIGCGTFDPESRARMHLTITERLDETIRQNLSELEIEFPDPDRRLAERVRLLLPAYSHDLITADLEIEWCDAQGHQESWEDMLHLQEDDTYPVAFAAIRSPVIMLHGSVDPHPGKAIRASLAPHLPQLEFHEWDRCGHYPWLERSARKEFLKFLNDWLRERS